MAAGPLAHAPVRLLCLSQGVHNSDDNTATSSRYPQIVDLYNKSTVARQSRTGKSSRCSTRPAVQLGKRRTAVPFSVLPLPHRRFPPALDFRNFAAIDPRISFESQLCHTRSPSLTLSLTLSRSAPASINTTAASPCPLSIAKCNGVIPARSAVLSRVLGRPSGGFRSS